MVFWECLLEPVKKSKSRKETENDSVNNNQQGVNRVQLSIKKIDDFALCEPSCS